MLVVSEDQRAVKGSASASCVLLADTQKTKQQQQRGVITVSQRRLTNLTTTGHHSWIDQQRQRESRTGIFEASCSPHQARSR